MNNRTRSSQVQQIRKNPLSRENEDKVGMQGTRSSSSEKATTSGRQATREKKLALLQDVDKLKKKLRDEENIHRALERAFNRPLGSLPRLPPYLPPNTLELLAEIAVLEEEVVRLEEQVVSCRQNLYQEAGYICSKRKLENPVDYYEQILSRVAKEEQSDQVKSPVSVARTPSSSSEIVSDRSSLSLGNTASGSSDVVSDQTVQSSNDLAKQKQPVEEPASIVGSGESGKVIGNQTSTSSNKKSDMVSHLTEETSSGLMNREQAMDEVNSTADSWENRKAKGKHSNGLMNGGLTSSDFGSSPKPNKNRKGKDDHTLSISTRKTQLTEKKFSTVKSPARMPSSKRQPSQKSVNSPMKQTESKTLEEDNEANKISEDMLKCLCSIFIRMSTANDRRNQIDTLPYPLSLGSSQIGKETKIQDPYGSVAEFKEKDIGLYKDLSVVDAKSIDLRRKKSALFLLHKLKLLLGKLARVKLDGLTHQHKLAFWINTYHSCLMNAFLEQGIPDSPEKVVSLAREATIVVAGQKLKAVTIEHFILRSPFYLKHGNKKAAKGEELNMFGLECTEPLVIFALSCGSWSSPAVRIYTASQVESELEAAKMEYIQAAVGISMSNKMVIPKLLEWHQLDFGKDFESLLDWVCLQLPDEIRKEALLCLQRKGKQPLQELVEVVPYDFTFRYLIHS